MIGMVGRERPVSERPHQPPQENVGEAKRAQLLGKVFNSIYQVPSRRQAASSFQDEINELREVK